MLDIPDHSNTAFGTVVRTASAVVVACLALALPTVAFGAVMTYMNLGDLVQDSNVVVRGEVEQQQTFRDSERGAVFTHTTIDVSTTYLGDDRESVTIEQWGGTYRGRTHRIPGDAQFEQGQEVVVFLSENHDDSDGPMYLSGLAQSKFEVVRGARASGDSAMVVRDLSEIAVVERRDGQKDTIHPGRQTWSLSSFEATLRSLTYAKSDAIESSGDTPNQTEGQDE